MRHHALCVTFLLCFCWPFSTVSAQQPNILLILADDLGWSDTGAYGNTFIDTPNIDRLAAEGIRLTRFYTNPVCSPSRAAILSGQHAVRTGVTDFLSPPHMRAPGDGEYIRGHWRPFEVVDTPRTLRAIPILPTVAAALSNAGYRTAYFGKWHLGFEPDRQPGNLGYTTSQVLEGHADAEGTPSLLLIEEATEEFLSTAADQPFFLFLSTTQPHIPLRPRPELLAKYTQRAVERGIEVPIPLYAAVVEELDEFVGNIRLLLQQRGVLDDTVFVFLSDNGGLENYDLGLGGQVTSNLPLRGEKGTLYEGGIRVPFIVRWPDELEAAVSVDTLAASYDLPITLAEIAGATFDGASDGESFLPALRGEAVSRAEPIFFHYPHYHHDRPASTIIDGDWKLIEFLDGGNPELYDLANDPGEGMDLAAAQPARVTAFLEQLQGWRESVSAQLPVPNANHDPARAAEWWAPFSNEPIDIELLRRIIQNAGGIPPE